MNSKPDKKFGVMQGRYIPPNNNAIKKNDFDFNIAKSSKNFYRMIDQNQKSRQQNLKVSYNTVQNKLLKIHAG